MLSSLLRIAVVHCRRKAWGLSVVLAVLVSAGIHGCAADVGTGGEAEGAQTEQALGFRAAGSSAARCSKDHKVRICHFTDHVAPPRGVAKRRGEHSAKVIEVSERALPTHLAHGDGLAPPSVKTDADCLVPQPPPEPVSVAATTGEDGLARFVIPQTNIRVVATILDEAGAPLPGMTADLFVAGSNYLMVAHDATSPPQHAPATARGSLLDARPGSAPTLKVVLALKPLPQLCGERVSNGTPPEQPNGCTGDPYQHYSLIAPLIGLADFQPACNLHDLCYDNCNAAKVDCDSAFLANLRQACASAFLPQPCLAAASQFYSAVSLLGIWSYDRAQRRVCDCCDPGEVACNGQCIGLRNGGFEAASSNPGLGVYLYASDSSIDGWNVVAGAVHYSEDLWQYSEGRRGLDMNGGVPGTISQTFATKPGETYTIHFSLAGNPDRSTQCCGGAMNSPVVKILKVSAAGSVLSYSFDVTGRSPSSMGWTDQEFSFSAVDTQTTIAFESLTASPYWGPTLDNVRLDGCAGP